MQKSAKSRTIQTALILEGLTLTDLIPGDAIAAMSNEEWDSAQEILMSWKRLCLNPDRSAPHIAGLRYWGEWYVDAREKEEAWKCIPAPLTGVLTQQH